MESTSCDIVEGFSSSTPSLSSASSCATQEAFVFCKDLLYRRVLRRRLILPTSFSCSSRAAPSSSSSLSHVRFNDSSDRPTQGRPSRVHSEHLGRFSIETHTRPRRAQRSQGIRARTPFLLMKAARERRFADLGIMMLTHDQRIHPRL